MKSTPDVPKPDLSHGYVCAFRGSRDQYQTALALVEVGALDRLVTDFYAPDALVGSRLIPSRLRSILNRRHVDGLSSRLARNRLRSAVPLASGRFDGHKVDDGIGALAARHAADGALIYSYYWHGFRQNRAVADSDGPQVVFQVHPFASQIKRVLTIDRENSGISDALEPEERLADDEIQRRENELLTADAIVVTSEFVRSGILNVSDSAATIGLAPYGAAESNRGRMVRPNSERRPAGGPVRLLWIGQLSYRKGPHWLLAAMRAVGPTAAELTIVTRDLPPGWLGQLPPNVTVRNNVPNEALGRVFDEHDLFVMPSLVEGYGLVYSESLAHGLPIVATQNSGAPELIEDGESGIIVAPGSVSDLVNAIESVRSNPDRLEHLRAGARSLSLPTWPEFRTDVRSILEAAESAHSLKSKVSGSG